MKDKSLYQGVGIATRESVAGNGTVRRPIVSTERKMITKQQQTFLLLRQGLSLERGLRGTHSRSTPGWP